MYQESPRDEYIECEWQRTMDDGFPARPLDSKNVFASEFSKNIPILKFKVKL
jgi:hypothetical protein